MKKEFVSFLKCADAAEAAFYTDYLAARGIPVTNTIETMRAWTGRYAQLSGKPVLRVQKEYVAEARKLLKEVPEADYSEMEQLAEKQAETWLETDTLDHCPLCGSSKIDSIPAGSLAGWLVWLFSLGLFKPDGTPFWVCRDCDWDSRRK